MLTRRDFKNLSVTKKDRIIRAILHMKNGPTDVYQKYVDWHRLHTRNVHGGIIFLAWHRIFIGLFEKDLIQADTDLGNDGKIALPYWKWYDDRSSNPRHSRGYLWRNERRGRFIGLGGNGDSADDDKVKDGPFKDSDWIISVTAGVALGAFDVAYIRRSLGEVPMPRRLDARAAMSLTDFDLPEFDFNAPGTSFRNVLEGFALTSSGRGGNLHNILHDWVGGITVDGTMAIVPISPNDPCFWLHHCNVDRLWAIWQQRNRRRRQYPTNADIDDARAALTAAGENPNRVRRRTDALQPWDGSAGQPSITTDDVLSVSDLKGALSGQEYRYDLNRVGSRP